MEIAIVGAGKTGRTLGRLARQAGYLVGPVVCRTRAHAEEAVRFIGAGRPGTAPEGAALTLVAVPDGEIAAVARALRVPPAAVVAHTCATYGAEVLRPLRPAGAVHPLRSFADPARAAELFPGTACAVDGDPEATAVLERFVRAIGGVPLRVKGDRKPLYHAAAVFASNYVVAVLEAALRLLEKAGVGRAEGLRALAPLASGTLANVVSGGIPEALTGPVERGDGDTVRRHVEALAAGAPELAGLYASLARLAIEVALAKGSIDAAAAGRVNAALGSVESVAVVVRQRKETSRRRPSTRKA
jgi:predicted short-subunit dehydrogenase-like oxidoreductase (DUF2520 family)